MPTTCEETTPLFQKIVPARGAAQKAAATLREQTKRRPRKSTTQKPQPGKHPPSDGSDGSDAADDDDHDGDDEVDITISQKQRGTGSRGLGTHGSGRGQGTGIRGGVRRRSSQKSTKNPSSPSRKPSLVNSESLVTPQKRSRLSLSPTPSKRTKLSTYHRRSQTSGNSSIRASLLTVSPSCRSPSKYENIYIENDVVWVRLNSRGVLVDATGPIDQLLYWWPAQVTSDDPLEVSTRLFGDDGHGNERLVKISSPSSYAVRSFRDAGRVRFSPSTFALPDSDTEALEVAEEVPSELLRCWTHARDQALEADLEDELPEAPSLINLLSVGKGKKKDGEQVDIPQTPSPSRLQKRSAAPLDEEIKVGEDGELVLASDHKGRPDHWPARVIGVHQDKRTGKWLYEVSYIDGKRKKMERNRFFTSDEDGFATCQLGKWRTEFPASDTEAPDSEDEMRGHYDTKSASPPPSDADLEAISNLDAFGALPLEQQMRYVYPFLCRVIRREYEPAYQRHDVFMKGGKAREQLGQAASMRGQFSENEVKKVSLLVRRAMLRNERWAERVEDGDEVCGGEQDTAPPGGSDGTKAESVAESIPVPSFDMDAAMALTELKSSDITHALPSISAPSVSVLPNHPDIDRSNNAAHSSSQTLTEVDTNAPLVPSSSVLQDQSSDMELDSDEEQTETSPHTAPSGNLKTPEAEVESLSNPSSKEIPVPPISRMRPKGCDAYEKLSRSERGLYCADVLFPEAVLQLHLLRGGHRRSARLLTPQEESTLYGEGQELLSESVHWITQIVQMRRLAENSYKRRTKKKDEAPVELIGGTSTRPRALKVS